MFKQGYSPSTVKAYLSGISYYIKSNGLEDVTQSFIEKYPPMVPIS
jgi:hypothetical protein